MTSNSTECDVLTIKSKHGRNVVTSKESHADNNIFCVKTTISQFQLVKNKVQLKQSEVALIESHLSFVPQKNIAKSRSTHP